MMIAADDNLRPSKKELLLLYKLLNTEIENHMGKGPYNFLRSKRNEVMQMMILQEEWSPDPTGDTAKTIAAYLEEDQYITSAPLERNQMNAFLKTPRDPNRLQQDLRERHSAMIYDLQGQQINYAHSFKNYLVIFNEQSLSVKSIVNSLQRVSEGRTTFMTDADMRQVQKGNHPYAQKASDLIEKINTIHSSDDKDNLQKLKEIYKELVSAKRQIPLMAKDLGLKETIKAQMKSVRAEIREQIAKQETQELEEMYQELEQKQQSAHPSEQKSIESQMKEIKEEISKKSSPKDKQALLKEKKFNTLIKKLENDSKKMPAGPQKELLTKALETITKKKSHAVKSFHLALTLKNIVLLHPSKKRTSKFRFFLPPTKDSRIASLINKRFNQLAKIESAPKVKRLKNKNPAKLRR